MDFLNLVDTYKDDIIRSVQEIVRIKSVEGEKKDNMPFGEGPYEALKYALNLSERLGFRTKNLDNYAGHAEYGEGDEIVGVLVHLDVVPEGMDGLTLLMVEKSMMVRSLEEEPLMIKGLL